MSKYNVTKSTGSLSKYEMTVNCVYHTDESLSHPYDLPTSYAYKTVISYG